MYYIPDDFENVEEYESDSDVEVDSDILDEWLNNGKVRNMVLMALSLKMNIFWSLQDGCGYKEPEIYLNGQLIDGDCDDFFDHEFRVDDKNENNRGYYRGISKVTYSGRVSK